MLLNIQHFGSPAASTIFGIPLGFGQCGSGRCVNHLVCHDAAPLLHPALQCAQVGSAEPVWGSACSRPQQLASGSSCSQPSTSHHTLRNGSLRVRQVRGGWTLGFRSACCCSSRHRSGSLARNRSRLSLPRVGLISGDTMAASADWASLMACSNATGSNVARCWLRTAFESVPTPRAGSPGRRVWLARCSA